MKKLLTMHRAAVSILALAIAIAPTTVAFATIDNTVTASGNGPGGAPITPATADETVDVIDAVDSIAITKVASTDTNVAVGTTVTYTYTATNTGNRTLSNVSMADTAHEGSGTVSTVAFTGSPLTDNGTTGDSTDDTADNEWDTLAPGDTVTWQATYTVTQADLNSNGGDGDGELTNTAVTLATAPGGAVDGVTATVDESIDLEDQIATLAVTKVADNDTNRAVGDIVTYTYTITNTGNVPITAVALADNVTAGSGTTPVPDADTATLTDNGTAADSTNTVIGDNQWDSLARGDVLTVTATYTVTQSDVDNLQ